MFIRNLLSLILGFLPFLINLYFLSVFLPFLQHAQGELQKSCSQTLAVPLEGICQLPCQCRPYPPLPPPPPPPLPPRLLSPTVAPSTVPPVKPWGREAEVLVLGIVSCASVVFLLLTGIICYKAIKRLELCIFLTFTENSMMLWFQLWGSPGKPLRKEENGTSRGEYAMSSRCKQQVVETNNTGV